MSEFELLVDLHQQTERQGPGAVDETRRALGFARRARPVIDTVADIGCGSGASTLVLAEDLPAARIVAVDLFTEFLGTLRTRAVVLGVSDRIETRQRSMDALAFEEKSLDLIWSEGAIYNIGFAAGVHDWRRFLKPGGILVVTEITWLTRSRPDEIENYWHTNYPEIDTAANKIAILEQSGYSLCAYFPLPASCWIDNYYRPLETHFDAFLARHDESDAARAIIDAEHEEIATYERFGRYYSYGTYVAMRV